MSSTPYFSPGRWPSQGQNSTRRSRAACHCSSRLLPGTLAPTATHPGSLANQPHFLLKNKAKPKAHQVGRSVKGHFWVPGSKRHKKPLWRAGAQHWGRAAPGWFCNREGAHAGLSFGFLPLCLRQRAFDGAARRNICNARLGIWAKKAPMGQACPAGKKDCRSCASSCH